MQEKKTKINQADSKVADRLIRWGAVLVAASVVLFVLVMYPVLKQEVAYVVKKPNPEAVVVTSNEFERLKNLPYQEVRNNVVQPVDEQFGIVIPKISANASVIADVDPYNSKEYQRKLTQGVAHAKGTVYPGEEGNTFLFAHSSDNFYNANRYNSVFYLLHKLEVGDEFFILYEGNKYRYVVNERKITYPDDVKYLSGESLSEVNEVKTATLMTCWPPGTTINRLVVIGTLDQE